MAAKILVVDDDPNVQRLLQYTLKQEGYDVILQAFTGMLSITGEPGGNPVRSPFSPVDQGTDCAIADQGKIDYLRVLGPNTVLEANVGVFDS